MRESDVVVFSVPTGPLATCTVTALEFVTHPLLHSARAVRA